MVSQMSSTRNHHQEESVIVVMDANRSKGKVDAVCWALKHVVRPGDTVVVLGILCELGRKTTSCFPFHMGIGPAGIWERLELSGSEVNPKELEEEIEKKRELYQSSLQPLYRQCRKNEVKLEVKLAAGFDAKKITIEEAQKSNTRWIVLDSHLKKEKVFIYGHVDCNIAVMKGKDVATLIAAKTSECSQIPRKGIKVDAADNITPDQCQTQPDADEDDLNDSQEALHRPEPLLQSPCWYPLAWRTGFPRSFTLAELEEITNSFGDEHIVLDHGDIKLYNGIQQETPVLVQRFSGSDHGQFWSVLKILSRVRHRNIMNLVGYCCTSSYTFLLFDYPHMGNLEANLRREDKALHLTWKLRWYIAQEIGGTLRYLHEECADGPIVHLSVSSSSIVFSQGCSAMSPLKPDSTEGLVVQSVIALSQRDHHVLYSVFLLKFGIKTEIFCVECLYKLSNFITAKLLKDDIPSNEASKPESLKEGKDGYLSADVHDYGMFLLELIAGKSAGDFQAEGGGQSLINWALPFLETDSLTEVMDPRLTGTDDASLVHHMARAALFCLKNNSDRRLSISEVLAVARGDKGWISKYPNC